MDASFYQQLCDQEEKLTKKLDAIRVLKANYLEEAKAISTFKPAYEEKMQEYPTQYSKELSWKQKIYVALHRIHKGFAEDIAVSLNKIDAEIPLETAGKQATGCASALFRDKGDYCRKVWK